MNIFHFIIKLLTTPPFYYWGFIILAIGLPLSEFLMSLSQFVIGGYWLLDGNFKGKWKLLKERKAILFIIAIWLIHLIGMLWSEDIKYGINDLRIKLPLLLLPIFIGTMKPITKKQLKTIFQFFIAAVFVGTMISIAVLLGLTHHVVNDIRDISIFISHIRFSLLINVAIIILVYFFLHGNMFTASNKEKKIYGLLILWLIVFLFILASFTGIIVFIILSFIFAIYFAFKYLKFGYRIFLLSLVTLIVISGIFFIRKEVKQFYNIENVNLSKLDKYTKEGNLYSHYTKYMHLENGHYIYLYIYEPEMAREWNKRSRFNYDMTDKGGYQFKYTIIRYLTSKGLHKDAEGVKKLTADDIRKIEHGIANCKYYSNNVTTKLYQLIWQIDCYLKGGNPSGHTLTQRIEYLKAATIIIKENFWFGVGTGDVKFEFNKVYDKINSSLSKEWRLRAHNQYITFFLSFGFVGFLLIIFCIVAPIIISKAYKFFIFNMFFITALLSMLNEDTLESQPGISYFAFFYMVFILAIEKWKEPEAK